MRKEEREKEKGERDGKLPLQKKREKGTEQRPVCLGGKGEIGSGRRSSLKGQGTDREG